jgi:hypothetical protein
LNRDLGVNNISVADWEPTLERIQTKQQTKQLRVVLDRWILVVFA